MNKIVNFSKLFIFVGLLLTLSACKTTERTTHQRVDFHADTLAQQSVQEGRVVDSLSRVTFNEWFHEQFNLYTQQAQETEAEQILEEITTVTDSAGTTTRTEKRSTTRTRDAQTAESSQAYQQDYAAFLDSLVRRIDELERNQGSLIKSTKEYNFSEDKEKTSKPSFSASFGWSLGVALAICIIAAVVLLYLRSRRAIIFWLLM